MPYLSASKLKATDCWLLIMVACPVKLVPHAAYSKISLVNCTVPGITTERAGMDPSWQRRIIYHGPMITSNRIGTHTLPGPARAARYARQRMPMTVPWNGKKSARINAGVTPQSYHEGVWRDGERDKASSRLSQSHLDLVVVQNTTCIASCDLAVRQSNAGGSITLFRLPGS